MSELGYDIIVEASEGLINRSLENIQKEKIIPVIKGKYLLDVPEILKKYQKLEYEITLTEPLRVDALTSRKIKIFFKAALKLSFSILQVKTDASGIIMSRPSYNRASNQLELEIQEIRLDEIKLIESIDLPGFLLNSINDIIRGIIRKGLDDLDVIPVSPIVGKLDLPEMPPGKDNLLPVGFGKVEVFDHDKVSVALDIKLAGNGVKASLVNINLRNDLAVAVSDSAVKKVLEFWWERTTYLKRHGFTDRIKIDDVDELINYFSNYSIELFPKLLTLGFVELDWDIINIWLDYSGGIEVHKPAIIMEEDNIRLEAETIVDLSAVLRIELDAALEFDTSGPIPDIFTPWKDDKVVDRSRRIFNTLRYNARQKHIELVNTELSLIVDDEQHLLLEIESFDLDVGLNWRLPRRVMKRLERNIEKKVLKEFPRIPLTPSVIRHQMEGSGLLLDLDIQSVTQLEDSMVVNADIKYSVD
ncbi:hypothetical protein GF326_03950 [Candidatus Bathyarchaeota archaeon]|nr:hypothetical protein [Candidatus Bathyarchaeota archaeon]